MEKLTAEINRIHKQQTDMWRSKVVRLQKERSKLQAENKKLKLDYDEQVSICSKCCW